MIYFDNASSTKPDKEALDIFYENSIEKFFNPNSIFSAGVRNFNDIRRFKDKILKDFKLDSSYEVIFNSGATESNNLMILGYARKNKNRGNRIITTKVEHDSVLFVFKQLEKEGFDVVYLDINQNGEVDLDQFNNVINDKTILVSIMGVNNEVGFALNIDEISKIVRKFPKCVFHSDCAQTLGKYPFNYSSCDAFTISAHKIYGIKGIGALIKRKKINLEPIFYGGGQENGLRSGTQDFPAIASFTYSINKVFADFNKNYKHAEQLKNHLIDGLSKNEEVILHLYEKSTPYVLNFSLKTKKASVVVEALSNLNIFVSSVSACNSKKEEPSHVLLALNKSLKEAHNSIRLSFSKDNTIEECDLFLVEFNRIIERIRG